MTFKAVRTYRGRAPIVMFLALRAWSGFFPALVAGGARPGTELDGPLHASVLASNTSAVRRLRGIHRLALRVSRIRAGHREARPLP